MTDQQISIKVEPPITGLNVFIVLALTVLAFFGIHFILLMTMSADIINQSNLYGSLETLVQDRDKLESFANDVAAYLTKGPSQWPSHIKWIWVVNQAIVMLPVVLFAFVMRKKPLTEIRLRPVPFNFILYGLAIGLGLTVWGDEIGRLIDLIVPIPDSMKEAIRASLIYKSSEDFLVIFLTVCILAPLSEEILFRGFFQRWAERTSGVTQGVLFTSALFAFVHGNQYFIIPIILMATILGAMTWRSESVLPAMAAHFVVNFVGMILVNMSVEDPAWYGFFGHVAPWWLLIGAGLIYFGLKRLFEEADVLNIGGHGPSGDVGNKLDKTV